MKNLVVAVVFVVCCFPAFALWNGEKAVRDQFPSTLYLSDCTASKIGKRHVLTAAHCVYDNSLKRGYRSGESLLVSFGLNNKDGKDLHTRTVVKETIVHDSYKNFVEDKGKVDIAVIVLEQDLPESIKIAEIESQSVRENQSIIIGGYGALGSNGFDGFGGGGSIIVSDSENSLQHLHFGSTRISRVYDSTYKSRGSGVNTMLGLGLHPSAQNLPLLGFGDSGGPVYSPIGLKIVGVNSAVSNMAFYSVYARVDSDSEHKIYQWLQKQLQEK